MPTMRLDGRRALVTGAGRGIGVAAAAALAEHGADVVLVARTRAQVERVAEAIVAKGGHASALALDVTDIEATAAAIANAGPFEVLVNNAGTNRPAGFLDVRSEDFDAIYSLNVRAAFFAAQAVARGLVAAKRPGSIINISSQMGKVGGPDRTVYCGTKFALEGFTRAAALDLAPYGIRVNTICPTFVETPLSRAFLQNEAVLEWVSAKIKLGNRPGRVEDLMGAIVYLAGDASRLVTGTSIVVDGGWTAE